MAENPNSCSRKEVDIFLRRECLEVDRPDLHDDRGYFYLVAMLCEACLPDVTSMSKRATLALCPRPTNRKEEIGGEEQVPYL